MTVQAQKHQKRLFTVDEYHKMAEIGILTEDDRIELLEGEIIKMAPIGSRHFACVNRLHRLLSVQLRNRAIVSGQNPVRLSQRSEPEPDIALLHPKEDDYASGLPTPADTYLLIEVADTTLAYDRDVKLPIYALASVPEVWLVDLAEQRIEVYSEPSRQGYRNVRYAYPGDTISPAAFAEVTLAVDEVLV